MLEDERQRRFRALLTAQVHEQAWRYATRLVRTREDAEDLLQEALTAAYRKLHQLRDSAAFKPWLLAIVRSRSRNAAARQRPPEFAATLWFATAQQLDSGDTLADEIALSLARLPATDREVLGLFYLDGLSLEETAAVLGITPLAVSQRLYRARQALRRQLGHSTAALAVTGKRHES